MTEKDPYILSYHDSIIRKTDMQTLNNSGWINDRLIGFMLEYFERELFSNLSDSVAFIQPEISQLIKLCSDGADIALVLDSLNLLGKQIIFLPINDLNKTTEAGGSHWTLLIYIGSRNCYLHMDSLCNSLNIYSAKITAKRLSLALKCSLNPNFIEIKDGPKQDNSYDCGMYVICAIQNICKRYLNDKDTEFIADHCGFICSSLTPQVIQQERLKLGSLIMSLKMDSA